jgi:subtilisin family serine protease
MTDRRDVLEALIYRSMGSRRFTQNSPVLPDVWIAYGLHPGEPQDLLLTPHVECAPADLARKLRERLSGEAKARARTAFNQTTVAATLSFGDLIRQVLPMSAWWHGYVVKGEGAEAARQFRENRRQSSTILTEALKAKSFDRWWSAAGDARSAVTPQLVWLARVSGTIALAVREWDKVQDALPGDQRSSELHLARALDDLARNYEAMVEALFNLLEDVKDPEYAEGEMPPLWTINRNRPTEASVYRSGKAVKADAVRQLFDVRGKDIRWAVIDSGIDATHLAFRRREARGAPLDPAFDRHSRTGRWKNQTRIRATYDFTRVRDLLSGDEETLAGVPEEFRARAGDLGLVDDLRKALKFGGTIDWGLLEKLLEVPHDEGYKPPEHHHGTHVAGIIGADWRAEEHSETPAVDRLGMAPEIELYDLRALDENGQGDEFSIMAAMQFVRYLNSRKTGHNLMDVHGVNLSFSIRHEISNFACGRTPVCDEAERLVAGGVVVVAAAGNQGRARYRTSTGQDDEGYRSISITDPGNAEAVITVGATHATEPHTYGVSYFSSRGPTGDGRRKPDLVAPGEKIYSAVPGQGEKDLDGTSQAAPHVSGAAALLMERNLELVGQPARIKQILCSSATDLGREPYFQGAGMLDVLRALQSV